MNIHVRSLPAKEVLGDIAAALGNGKETELRENRIAHGCTELFLTVPPAMGEGTIDAITFPSGFSLYHYDVLFNRDIMINFNISEIQPLKFIFCSAGHVLHSFEDKGNEMRIDLYQNIIVAGDRDTGHNIHFAAGERVRLTSLEIDRPIFKRFHAYMDDGVSSRLISVLADTDSSNEFYYQGNYSLTTADMIQDQLDTRYNGFLRFLFLKGTSNILLALQIEQFIDDELNEGLPHLLRRRDLENVRIAIGIMTGDMQTSFSVNQLAARTGTNANKLQEGFRHLHDMTINKYMLHLRLERATSLMEHSELNISEIVSAIGLNSRSYFSKVFREAYGVTPMYFRSRINKH